MSYKCTFVDDTAGHYERTIDAWDAETAAEMFAEYAYGNHDMREHEGPWTGDRAIRVVGSDGTGGVFQIDVEFEPNFIASHAE